jgi:UDP-2,3-diacylglucosamine pyrophosphatase LpxH
MVIIAVSDQHLGDNPNSDRSAFSAFLDDISRDQSVTDLVLLGDVVDMWRRDASGVFLENADILDKIVSLKNRMKVHYVAGNHDYHVLHLKGHAYPFDFVEKLTLKEGGRTYQFEHGNRFDPAQQVPFMEALCRTMSDTAGSFESGVWATLTGGYGDLYYFFVARLRKGSIRKKLEDIQRKPKERAEILDMVEKDACGQAKPPGEVLVFGHTHRPFINKSETVVNTGSWVKDAPVHNTYARLDASGPKLFIFPGQEITERVQC